MKLYSKLLLAVVPVALVSAQAVIVHSRRATHRALLVNLEKTSLEKSADLSGALEQGFSAASERLLLPALQSCQRGTSALYVLALDQKGRVLSHTNVGEVGQVYGDPLTLGALSSAGPRAEESLVKGQHVLDVSVPVLGALKQEGSDDFLLSSGSEKRSVRLGTLRMGLPLADALATEGRISAQMLRIVLISGTLTVVFLLLFLRSILAPIGRLAAATAKIRAGEYGTTIPISSEDEIGSLARSFNEMSQDLARTTVSKDFFNDILQSIHDQLIVTDAEGRMKLVNPSLLALVGYAKEELVGRPASILFDPKEDVFSASRLQSLTAGGSMNNVSTNLLGKTGEKVPILFSGSILRAQGGAAAGFIGVAKDISELKRLEARMHQSEKLSAVGQLAAGVAHEVNNPLGVILGFAQGMARQLQAGHALELPIKSIEREAIRCKALVQNLLTFARTSHADRGPMDLNSCIEQTSALLQAQAKMTQVQVVVKLAPGLPPILGNKNQIEQVILNLAKNAIDAMPNSGTLSLTTELVEAKPHSWICLRVADTGTGIPPGLMAKIFEPFFTTKPVGQGTGLGLSLVNEIVRKHSGDVEVESRPGMTTFTVKFPARTGRELEERVTELQKEKLASPPIAPYQNR